MELAATLVLIAAAVGAGVACAREHAAAGSAAPAAGGPRSDFRLASLEGRELGPPDFADHVVLVDFWATWCMPCRAQAEILHDLHAELADDGVQFLAVDVGEPRDQVKSFVAERPFPYPVLLDPDSRLADSMGIFSLPTLMIVDRRGGIALFEPGVHGADELRNAIARASGGGPA